ncbi:enolase C-terminal domain-like protein, partial [Burkholderia ambifaria]|uniref:enolase C-terminal domain-like protein n=1 Tax=Burkholderia ambifaria TaxID=152480 RepID=UPI0024462F87
HGKRLGVPVSELLGGRRRDRLPVAWTLASGHTATDIAEAERALGERASVRVDVNMAWSETQAARAIPALADAGCELVEQPV